MESPKTEAGISFTNTPPGGATIKTAYAGREIKVFAVSESEVEMMKMFNTLGSGFITVGSSLISFAIGIWTSAAFADKPTPEGVVLTYFGASVLIILALLFFAAAWWTNYSKKSTWTTICSESKADIVR